MVFLILASVGITFSLRTWPIAGLKSVSDSTEIETGGGFTFWDWIS